LRIGIRKSPHLETLAQSILTHGDELVDVGNTGADAYLAWGWPQMQTVTRSLPKWVKAPLIIVDCHPFALEAGDRSGSRIFQLNNWGALAQYPAPKSLNTRRLVAKSRSDEGGPVLVLGQVRSTEQIRQGFVDVWHTPGCDAWLKSELEKPNRKLREHPREWVRLYDGQRQPMLAEDLEGCSRVVGWNSTALVHARRLGYPVEGVDPHA
jgi:hypothetical protein